MGVEVIITQNKIPELAARFPGALDAVLSAAMERVVEYAVANHPWNNETGETEASIRMEALGDHAFAAVAGGAMIFLEFGTIHMPPFPTMGPAYDATYPEMIDSLQRLGDHIGFAVR